MDKRYQVFVSSTYEDLHEERREVMQALLALDCIPTGMELFPAADDDSWTHIKHKAIHRGMRLLRRHRRRSVRVERADRKKLHRNGVRLCS